LREINVSLNGNSRIAEGLFHAKAQRNAKNTEGLSVFA
jgi:hypothetical protein